MKTVWKKAARFFNKALFVLLCALALFQAGVLAYKTVTKSSLVLPFGYGASVVLSGSMEPELSVDDLVLLKESDGSNIETGDIVVFEKEGSLIIHRVVETEGDTLITKGDSNNEADAAIERSEVRASLLKVIPNGGMFVRLMQNPLLYAGIFLVWYVFRYFLKDKKEKKDGNLSLKEAGTKGETA